MGTEINKITVKKSTQFHCVRVGARVGLLTALCCGVNISDLNMHHITYVGAHCLLTSVNLMMKTDLQTLDIWSHTYIHTYTLTHPLFKHDESSESICLWGRVSGYKYILKSVNNMLKRISS